MVATSMSATHPKGGSGCNGRFRSAREHRAGPSESSSLMIMSWFGEGSPTYSRRPTIMIIVGEAATAADALHRIPAAAPDVALLDARLPDGSGIDVCREIRSSS